MGHGNLGLRGHEKCAKIFISAIRSERVVIPRHSHGVVDRNVINGHNCHDDAWYAQLLTR